ncbi:hypothetical protein NQ152_03675 [Microbacterium sp. zg.B48]|uniref:hypothetical protein n=1 Tax=Microbacterium sp. zg.B48 TaxID=2969408 RepID=UPI00214C7DF1|nr:hypothetical protein [Microbacterium sp. zg.B48]MCR2762604.1 hypothetical protein [Microbacterium sp. zg.B48]
MSVSRWITAVAGGALVLGVLVPFPHSAEAATFASTAAVGDAAPCPLIQRTVASDALGSTLDDSADTAGGIFSGVATTVLTGVISGAAGKVGGALVGWALDALTGGPGPTPIEEEELADLQQIQTQLSTVQQEITTLNITLQQDELALANQIEVAAQYGAYVTQVTAANTALENVRNDIQLVCQLSANLTTSAQASGNTSSLSADQIDELKAVVESGQQSVNALDEALIGTDGQSGVFGSYRALLWAAEASGSSTPSGTLLPSELANKMQAQAAFYAGVTTLHLNAYAEAVHLSATGGVTADLQNYYENTYVPSVQAWSYLANDNLPTLPDGVSADLSTPASPNPGSADSSGFIRVWTTSPVTLAGTDQDRYCMYPSTCYAADWAPAAASVNVIAASVVPATAVLASYLAVPQAGMTGWRIPQIDDFTSLAATRAPVIGGIPAGVTVPDISHGVSAWAAVEGIPALQAAPVTAPNGTFQTIPPVLVDWGQAQVLGFNDPNFSQPEPFFMGDTGQGFSSTPNQSYGGALMVVQDLPVGPPETPPFPAASSSSASTPVGDAALAAQRDGVVPFVANPPSTSSMDAAQATTFTTPADCNSGANEFVQPSGYNAVTIVAVGAKGGNGMAYDETDSQGGTGGVVTATVPVIAGSQLFVGVGGAGQDWQQNTGQGGAGGLNGGGVGGSINGYNGQFDGVGAGGGGSSQVSLDESCSLPLVVAGGGGGSGSSNRESTTSGGNACVSLACAGTDGDGGGGGGTLTQGGANWGSDASPLAGAGAPGAGQAGGAGGSGGAPGGLRGLGGGGGGGGFTGGGGGGGASGDVISCGNYGCAADKGTGGGAGGSSFATAGAIDASFELSSAAGYGPNGSVTITPIVVPEFSLVADDASGAGYRSVQLDDQLPPDVIAVPVDASDPSQVTGGTGWATLTLPFDPTTLFGSQLFDPVSQLCVDAQNGGAGPLQMIACDTTGQNLGQRWSATVLAGVAGGASSMDFHSGSGVSVSAALGLQGQGLILVPGALWTAGPPLKDALSEEPPAPAEPEAPSPETPPASGQPSSEGGDQVEPDTNTARSGKLASTGSDPTLWLAVTIAGAAAGVLGGMLLARRRRAATADE